MPDGTANGAERQHSIKKIVLRRFTAFESLAFHASPGINVLVGENETGKTHLMKIAYAACSTSKDHASFFLYKLNGMFLPSGDRIGRLVNRGGTECYIQVQGPEANLEVSFYNRTTDPDTAKIKRSRHWQKINTKSVYIPPKDTLADAQGFRSIYDEYEVFFDEVYYDIISKAYLPALRGPIGNDRKELLAIIKKAMGGRERKVSHESGEFFLESRSAKLELTLVAEGIRKIALLQLLIRNGTLSGDTILFWDEPESNLNPKLYKSVIELLLKLQRQGSQIFIATHDYVIIKEFDLQKKPDDAVVFHSLYREPSGKRRGEISVHTTDRYLDIHPNAIADTFDNLYDRDVERSLAGFRE